jgi:hypothetical protein
VFVPFRVPSRPRSISIMKVTPNNPIAEFTCFQGIAIGAGIMIALAFLTGGGSMVREEDDVRVAMIGNSLMYYNDLP